MKGRDNARHAWVVGVRGQNEVCSLQRSDVVIARFFLFVVAVVAAKGTSYF